MKRIIFLILAILLCVFTMTACAGKQKTEPQAVPGIYKGESVPELILVSLTSDAPFDNQSYQPANYSWNWPKGNGENGGVEACGIGPTDPAVMELRDPILLSEAITVKLVWPNFQAHSVTIVSWDTAVFDLPADADASKQDNFLRDTELTEEDDFERTLVLEPNRVYDIYAYWQEVNGSSFGNAHYYVVTKGDSDSEKYEPAPADMVDSLFASGDITLTLLLANDGACNTYPANEWYSGRFKVLLDGYSWTKLEMPLTEPSEFWLTAASADGTIKITFWSNSGAGMVQYSDGNASSFWSATPAADSQESIAKDIRMEYDNLDVDFSRIAFGMEGTAEDAADYFVHTALGEHMESLEPGSIYGISDYEVVQWTVRETSESGDAVVGSLNYAFTPWDYNSPGIWAGNTAEGTGDYEGKLTCYREFVLQQQEDGFWHCIGLGTGGYTLPE